MPRGQHVRSSGKGGVEHITISQALTIYPLFAQPFSLFTAQILCLAAEPGSVSNNDRSSCSARKNHRCAMQCVGYRNLGRLRQLVPLYFPIWRQVTRVERGRGRYVPRASKLLPWCIGRSHAHYLLVLIKSKPDNVFISTRMQLVLTLR